MSLRDRRAALRDPKTDLRPIVWSIASLIALIAIIVWQLIVIYWVGSMGAKAGIGLGILASLVLWLLRKRPWTAALLCLVMLASLQVTLVVLASRADTLVSSLAQHDGKLRSFAFRLDYWQGAMKLFVRHPITGVGPGQFRRAYPQVKPVRAAEEVAHPHNGLLAVAAEWGIFGLLGILVAMVLPAWLLLRSRQLADPALSREPAASDASVPFNSQPLLLACATVCLCWLVFLPGVVPAGSDVFLVETLPALPLALAAAALVSIPSAWGSVSLIALLGGLVAFFVHATVEMSSGVAGATWPFWATAALALAGSGRVPSSEPDRLAGWWALRRPVFVLAAAGSLAVLVLSFSPMRAIWAMGQAKNALESRRTVDGEVSLRAAADADGLDPAPREALSEFYRRMAGANRRQTAHYLQQAVACAQAAVQRDPASHALWHDLAWTTAELAAMTQDFSLAEQAIEAMRRAVRIYPNWPRGHLKLAMLLGGASEPPDYRPVLLKEALAEFDTALRLNEQWPSEDPNKFDEKDLSGLHRRRQDTLAKLQNPPSWPARSNAP